MRWGECGGADERRGRYSAGLRGGGSHGQQTEWLSATSVLGKLAGGTSGSATVAMTLGAAEVGSMSGGVSYDVSEVSAGASMNQAGSGGGSVSVFGANVGRSRWVARGG